MEIVNIILILTFIWSIYQSFKIGQMNPYLYQEYFWDRHKYIWKIQKRAFFKSMIIIILLIIYASPDLSQEKKEVISLVAINILLTSFFFEFDGIAKFEEPNKWKRFWKNLKRKIELKILKKIIFLGIVSLSIYYLGIYGLYIFTAIGFNLTITKIFIGEGLLELPWEKKKFSKHFSISKSFSYCFSVIMLVSLFDLDFQNFSQSQHIENIFLVSLIDFLD